MSAPAAIPRQVYLTWIEEQIEEFKTSLTRDELLGIADEAVNQLFTHPDGQYPLTEMLLCDAVDTLIFQRLNLPDYKQWVRQCQKDTSARPPKGTQPRVRKAS